MISLRMRALSLTAAAAVLLTGCDIGTKDNITTGFRGLGMEHNRGASELADSVNTIGERAPNIAAPGAGPAMPAGTYENVQVLGHLSQAEFVGTMTAITQWVAPEEGCVYCHVQNDDGSINFASEDNYTKHVARTMFMMTQNINTEWTSHVQEGRQVNCWTCHQGQTVPTNYWHYDGDPAQRLRHYLDRNDFRLQQAETFRVPATRNTSSINQTVYAYQLMSQMSNALGVNCTFCHNTARFADWSESPPQRVTALRGLNMVRESNMEYMVPLQDVWPDYRLGPVMGDGPKIQCSTCHIGAYKPQYNNPASYGAGWRALTEVGHANPPMPAGDTGVEASDGGS